MTALKTALWWTEFVLKHEQEDLNKFLRPYNVDQSWIQRRQLDAWLLIGVIVSVTIALTVYVAYYLVKLLLFRSKGKEKIN